MGFRAGMRHHPTFVRGIWLLFGWLLALVLLAAAAPAAFAGSVTFRPARVAQGGAVKGSGHVFATLKVSGRLIQSEPSSTYTDTYEIDRFPVQ